MDALKEHLYAADAASAALSVVAGPYAFVFHDEVNSRLYFGRDFLGRRSLLWRVSTAGDIFLCSIADNQTSAGWSPGSAQLGWGCAGARGEKRRGFPGCYVLRWAGPWSPRQESNLYLALRRHSFYPLNYGEI